MDAVRNLGSKPLLIKQKVILYDISILKLVACEASLEKSQDSKCEPIL